MRQVILMRHAKSDWSSGASSDHNRPLNARGRTASEALGDWLRAQDMLPDQVLCSSAMRTRETCLRLALPQDIDYEESKDLYLADPEQILTKLKGATGNRVLVLGHNPGIGMVAEALLKTAPDHLQFMRYPTGATLVAEFEIDRWAQATWGNANARHFVVPRDLP